MIYRDLLKQYVTKFRLSNVFIIIKTVKNGYVKLFSNLFCNQITLEFSSHATLEYTLFHFPSYVWANRAKIKSIFSYCLVFFIAMTIICALGIARTEPLPVPHVPKFRERSFNYVFKWNRHNKSYHCAHKVPLKDPPFPYMHIYRSICNTIQYQNGFIYSTL